MARIACKAPRRYWERDDILLTKREVENLLRALTLIVGCDLDAGVDTSRLEMAAKRSAEAKLRRALERMRPNPDACAACQHHRTYHKQGGCQHIVSCYNDTCACNRFRGQR